MSAPRLTTAQKREIVRRYKAGDPISNISADFGVHVSYPTVLARRYGASPRSSETKGTNVAAALQRRAWAQS